MTEIIISDLIHELIELQKKQIELLKKQLTKMTDQIVMVDAISEDLADIRDSLPKNV